MTAWPYADEEHWYTPHEVAEILRVSVDTVYRHFGNIPGVIVLVQERKRGRTKRTIRIPSPAIDRLRN